MAYLSDRVKVIGNKNEVKMVKPSKLQESLSPFEPLLHFCFTQFFVVDGDKLTDQLKGVKHLVNAVGINYFGPFQLGHLFTLSKLSYLVK